MASRKSAGSKLNDKMCLDRRIGSTYKIIGNRIGVGNFGEVRLGIDVKSKNK